jgi:hypothetical protein
MAVQAYCSVGGQPLPAITLALARSVTACSDPSRVSIRTDYRQEISDPRDPWYNRVTAMVDDWTRR